MSIISHKAVAYSLMKPANQSFSLLQQGSHSPADRLSFCFSPCQSPERDILGNKAAELVGIDQTKAHRRVLRGTTIVVTTEQ